MGKVTITNIKDAPWVVEKPDGKGPRKIGTQMIGEEDTPGMRAMILNKEPNWQTSVHSHSTDELIHVLEGELVIGQKRLGPGSLLLIEKDTQYQFKAGPNGLRFMNIRPGPASIHRVGEQPIPERWVRQQMQGQTGQR